MKVWIETNHETEILKIYDNENPYGVEADIPEHLIAGLKRVDELRNKIVREIFHHIP
jgi:hypothetical protein